MGHYASEMQMPLSKEEERAAKKYYALEEKIRNLPASCVLIGELAELLAFNAHGLRSGDSWSEERAKFWRNKIKRFERQEKIKRSTQ